MATTVLLASASHVGRFSVPKVIDLTARIEGIEPFDSVALIGHRAHNQFETYGEDLHVSTVVAFPIFRCEFEGGESPDEIRVMRRDFVPTLEWDRRPHPKLSAAFHNPLTGSKGTNDKPKPAKLSDLVSILRQMKGCQGAWLKLENWRRRSLFVRFDGAYKIRRHDGSHISTPESSFAELEVCNFSEEREGGNP